MASFKSKCQQISKLKETIQIEEDAYNDLLRIWNITANEGEIEPKINKFKDCIKGKSSFDKLVQYQDGECYNELSGIPSRALENVTSPMNIINNFNVDTSERQSEKCSQDSACDVSLFCNEVKFGIVYTCCYCENVFSSKHSLARHKRKHNFCPYCKAKFKTFKALTYHRKSCIFEKCMTSYPRVELPNIGLSRKMRTLYRSAFSKEKFPIINCLTFDIKKEFDESNAHNSQLKRKEIKNLKKDVNFSSSNSFNNIVKFEPIEYEDNTECNYSIFQDTEDNIVKLEAVDIVENQFINENLSSSIKEEFVLDYCPENSNMNLGNNGSEIQPDLKSKIDDKINNIELSMDIDPITSCDIVIDSEKNLDRKIYVINESHLDEDDSYCRTTRFCRFRSEMERHILSQPETQYKFAYEFVRGDYDIMKNKYLDCISSKEQSINSEKNKISVQTETQNLNEEQLKSDIASPKITSDQYINDTKRKPESRYADSVSTEQLPIKKESKCSFTKAENEKIITQSIKLEVKDTPNLASSKISTSQKTNIPHNRKTSYLQRVKYVRFTNKPNLNLFMF